MKKQICAILIVSTLIISGFNLPSYAETIISDTKNAIVDLRLSPSHIEGGDSAHPNGYVSLVSKNGIPGTLKSDSIIKLKSDNPEIASVPETVTIEAGKNFANFDIHVKADHGETSISASLNGHNVFQKLLIGDNNLELPDDVALVIHFPSTELHVESETPFSVFLQTSDEELIQAPYDIEVKLDFEDSLINVNQESLTIEKGNYYAWGIVSSNEKVGNAFIRAFQDELNLQTAEKLRISSSFPSGLSIDVFPKIVPREVLGDVDIIVSLLDSDGQPTLAQEDIQLEFFSNNDYVGKKIDDQMKETPSNGVIKKGEFSSHFKQKLNLISINPEIEIGVSTDGLGIATDCFISREAYTFDNPIAGNKTLQVFTLDNIPSNSKSIAVYQIGALIPTSDEEDFDSKIEVRNPTETQGTCDVDKYLDSEDLVIEGADGEFFPLLSNENLMSTGSFSRINVISSDRLLLGIEDNGKIENGYSYGTAIVSSGKETGPATLATTIKGVGSATVKTNVINTLKHDKTIIFSPTGSKNIRFDKNGNFDLFLVALDSKNRPTFVENEAKYLLSPANEIIQIEKDSAFSHASFKSDSFSSSEDEKIRISASPVGISADHSLQASTTFQRQPSAMLKIIFPYSEIDVSGKSSLGIVQLVDFRDNPVTTSDKLKVKIDSSNSNLVTAPRFVEIPQGNSYATFPLDLNGKTGKGVISANANGVIGAEEGLMIKNFLTKISISTGSVLEPIPPGESIEIKLYADSETNEPIEGAELKIVGDKNSTITPTNLKTEKDGGAKFHLTTNGGPTASFQVFASAEGYVEEEKRFEFTVDTGEVTLQDSIDFGLPDWVLYVGLAAIGIVIGVVALFLKKPKIKSDHEEDDIFLEEDI